jgi:hypothetical protein
VFGIEDLSQDRLRALINGYQPADDHYIRSQIELILLEIIESMSGTIPATHQKK